MFAADIAEFTRPDRDDDVRRFMHEELYRILEQAFDGSGIPWSACFREDRGDGAGDPAHLSVRHAFPKP